MSKAIKQIILIFTLAGILMTPACSPIDGQKDPNASEVEIITTPGGQVQQGQDNSDPAGNNSQGSNQGGQPQETKEPIQVITNDEELDEYFNSISDEELEELFRIIEGIDISDDINPEADPGFDDVVIP